MNKVVLIDADTILYLATYSKESEKTIQEVFNDCDAIIENIFKVSEAKYYSGYLTDGSFRYEIAKTKPYKGNRVGIPKPKYFNLATSYLKDKWLFTTKKNYEADDLCIMAHNTLLKYREYEPIIASPDKDLRQIAGKFYDYKKKETEKISSEVAYKNLWKQVLTGDSGDNIVGIPGIGDVKAEKILNNSKIDYSNTVLNGYTNYYGQYEGIIKFTENYQLVKMLDTLPNEELFIPTLIEIKSEIDEWLK